MKLVTTINPQEARKAIEAGKAEEYLLELIERAEKTLKSRKAEVEEKAKRQEKLWLELASIGELNGGIVEHSILRKMGRFDLLDLLADRNREVLRKVGLVEFDYGKKRWRVK